MKIAMFTNTYLPLVGGASISIKRFSDFFRSTGHDVLVVAPEYDDQPKQEEDVIRVPALKNFNSTHFSVPLPLATDVGPAMNAFQPDLIHAHHPFFLGDTALRVAATRAVPIVVTHHTSYEQYIHYVPGNMSWLEPYVFDLYIGHANLCDAVIAPSESIKQELCECGVNRPVHVIPTGVDLEQYENGNGSAFRREFGIPEDAFLIGHVGRLNLEKNLDFLARGVVRALDRIPGSWFVVVGDGPSAEDMQQIVHDGRMEGRCVFAGVRKDQALVDGYSAMDVFAFASKSETQGMVLVEAMASGTPVVAMDAPGTRDIIRDEENGRLISSEDENSFAEAIAWTVERREELAKQARHSVEPYAMETCAKRMLDLYHGVLENYRRSPDLEASEWDAVLRALRTEWEIWSNRINALGSVLKKPKNE